jgi:HlyD family secretion protein/adhesin transport system membrane fusion protein
MSELVPAVAGNAPIRISGRQLRFLPQSDYLEEAGAPALTKLATWSIAALVSAFVGWSALAEIDEAAISPGEIVPTRRNQVVQHLEGGIVAEVLVQDGDQVDEGQVLVRMDPAGATAELDQMRVRYMTLQLKAVRLLAFASEREPDFSFAGPQFSGLVEDQRSILRAQVKSRDSQRQVLGQQIAQREAELTSIDVRLMAHDQSKSLLEEELGMRRKLYEKRLQSKVVLLDSQRRTSEARGVAADLEQQRQKAENALAEARHHLVEAEMRLHKDALSEMGDVTAEMAQLHEAIIKIEERVQRLEVKTPLRGVVKGLRVRTAGRIVGPAEPILEIVPTGMLVAETRISARDIGHVRIGQAVKVKVATFDFSRYGAIRGTLVDVSASTFADEDGVPYYKGTIWLDQQHAGKDPSRNLLAPGMTVQADIDIGGKTLLEYLLKPVHASIDMSFRER